MNTTASIPVADKKSGKLAKTIGYYLAFIVLGLITGVFGPTLPDLARNTQTALNQISLIFAARSIGYLAGSFLSGRLYDRVRGHWIIAAVLLATAIAYVLIPMIPVLPLLVIVLLALGIAEGAIDVGGNSLIVWVHHDRVGPYMNGLHFFFGIGAFISPIVIAQVVLSTGDFRWAYWLLALLIVPVAVWFTRLPSPPIEHASQKAGKTRTNTLFLLLIAALLFVYVGVETGFGNWIFTYATRLNLADATGAALLTSTFWGSFTLGRLLGVPISTRVKPGMIILIDLVGCLASVIAVVLFPQSQTVLWLGTIGAGLFMASVFPTALALAGQFMTITAQVTGWFLIGAGSGAMLFPWLVGQLIEPFGSQVMTQIVLFSLVGDLVLLSMVMLAARKSTRDDKDGDFSLRSK
jgi:FHS family Na+ dependent glucose MFS transporter 1